MHAFHEYISNRLFEHLKKNRVMVWYDTPGNFAPYLDELEYDDSSGEPVSTVTINELKVRLARFNGSFMALRAAVEPYASIDLPDYMICYISGAERDPGGSMLMELEKAGICYEPLLKRQARNVLRTKYTDGVIDDMLSSETLTYQDVARLLEGEGGEEGAALRLVFPAIHDNVRLICSWLTDPSHDETIANKNATGELYKLIENRSGLLLKPDESLDKARSRTISYVLVNEFRADLDGEAPFCVSMVPEPSGKDELKMVRDVAVHLRENFPAQYIELADKVEFSLGLGKANLEPDRLGAIDTFRFEEQILLDHCCSLIARGQYAQAMELVEGRRKSFWAVRFVLRQSQWELASLMTDLGLSVGRVRKELEAGRGQAGDMVEAYTREGGWFTVDMIQRKMEAWVAKMNEEPRSEQALAIVRREYETLLQEMTNNFSYAFKESSWNLPGILPQTHIYPDLVKNGGRTAYFLVDAMRFEMGAELAGKLEEAKDLNFRPAAAALPTITPVGMAALLPGASASFSVVESKDKLAARIDDTVMPGLNERRKLFKTRVPGMKDILLGKLLQMSTKKLGEFAEDSSLLVVRSQEVDALGELGDESLARQLMDTVIDNIARAVRKLAGLGIERFVVTADHGYQFSLKKEEDMQTDAPGGKTVEIHRRCWAGKGGSTPTGAVRVTGTELGYDTDLDFIFPTSLAVLPAKGGLRFHHGGISLQEVIIPVVSFRMGVVKPSGDSGYQLTISDYPEKLTNRTLSMSIELAADLLTTEPVNLRIVLISDGRQVGKVGMAADAELDRVNDQVIVPPGKKASLGLMLIDDSVDSIKISVIDPITDAVLAESKNIPVKLEI